MTTSNTEQEDEERAEEASSVVYTLSQEADSKRAAERIVALGQERLKSIQAAGVNLDGRTAQVAALELAAAAFTAGIAAGKDTPYGAAWLAALSCFLFIAGACTALLAIQSCKTQAAGIEPHWWTGALDVEMFNDEVALSWAAKETQRSIDTATSVDVRRGQMLNRSILLSVIAGACAFLAATTKIIWP